MTGYNWINDALAWLAPVAAGGYVDFQVNALTAFVDGVRASYEAPEPLPVSDPVTVEYSILRTLAWGRVESLEQTRAGIVVRLVPET